MPKVAVSEGDRIRFNKTREHLKDFSGDARMINDILGLYEDRDNNDLSRYGKEIEEAMQRLDAALSRRISSGTAQKSGALASNMPEATSVLLSAG